MEDIRLTLPGQWKFKKKRLKMKNKPMIFGVILLALALNACTGQAAATPTQPPLDAIYTSIVKTITAQALAYHPSQTPAPKETAAPQMTATPEILATEPAAVNSPVPTATVTCDNAAFLSDVTVKDGESFAPGQAFTKTWQLQNNGSCAWNKTFVVAFVSGSSMSGETTPLTSIVDLWKKADISVAMVAPTTPGTHTGYWRLKNAAGTWFGQSFYVKIVVSGDSNTITPTNEGGATNTPTSDATSTKTPKPTKTPTPED
jgi:Ig-like domain from next to BRCA1 gene